MVQSTKSRDGGGHDAVERVPRKNIAMPAASRTVMRRPKTARRGFESRVMRVVTADHDRGVVPACQFRGGEAGAGGAGPRRVYFFALRRTAFFAFLTGFFFATFLTALPSSLS